MSGATTTLREEPRPYTGVLVVPGQRNRPEGVLWPECTWAMDNGAFSAFDAEGFVDMLYHYQANRATCQFVAVPDVVADAEATRRRFDRWARVVRAYGYRVALVGQDGLTPATTPWDEFDALFLGGSTDWKLGREARNLVGIAKALGKWVHMGRVNSIRRLRYAERIGCDSVDGSGFSRFPSAMLRKADQWHAQPSLSLEVA